MTHLEYSAAQSYSATQGQRQASREAETLRRPLDFSPFAASLGALEPERLRELEALVLGASAAQLAAWQASGQLSAEDLTLLHLSRIQRLDAGQLNSVLELNPNALADARALDAERRSGQVRSPLHGLTVLIKDNVAAAGMHWTAGAAALSGHRAGQDAPLVARLREAGAVILGKTNLSEWSNFMTEDSVNGYSVLGGHTRNPYGPFDVGGSSSGSAVAAAMNFATFTVGTETSGSLIYPGRQNALAVLKPTLGLISRSGILPITEAQDTAGPMARSVADLAQLLPALVGCDPADPVTAQAEGFMLPAALDPAALRGVRVALCLPGDLPAEARRAIEAGLAAAGAQAVAHDFQPPESDWRTVMLHGMQQDLPRCLREGGAPLTTLAEIVAFNAEHPARAPYGQSLLEQALDPAAQVSPEQYAGAKAANREQASAALDGLLAATGARWTVSLSNELSGVYSAAGYPALTVPAGQYASGEPFGVTFIGPALSDAELIQAAYAYEQATQARRDPAGR
ncbi:MAG: amidase family protein [Deinococcus sp.]|nr:amidase family protein [Deinococcus sp.]